MKKYESMIVNKSLSEDELNMLNNDGWRVVGFSRVCEEFNGLLITTTTFILEREKKN